ncbi:MAG TPA: tetratricopeptide repeat protein [Verrucomicrobiae bacterium]|nr:tetratricopeptide repeat protein [Verrucomicrobiae bacterium]
MTTLEPPDNHFLDAATGWLMLGNAEEARSEFEQLSPKARMHPDALDFQWRWLAHLKRWEEAVDVAQLLIDKCPRRADAWIHRSFALHELRRTQEAFDLLLPALKKFPKEMTIPYNLACYTSQLGDLAAARQWFQKALTLGKTSEEKLERLQAALEDLDLKPLWPELRKDREKLRAQSHS